MSFIYIYSYKILFHNFELFPQKRITLTIPGTTRSYFYLTLTHKKHSFIPENFLMQYQQLSTAMHPSQKIITHLLHQSILVEVACV